MEYENYRRRDRVNPRKIARSVMFWLKDPSEQLSTVTDVAKPEDGYVARNESDWPARICGTLSLRDIFEVAKGVKELQIEDDATVDNYSDNYKDVK